MGRCHFKLIVPALVTLLLWKNGLQASSLRVNGDSGASTYSVGSSVDVDLDAEGLWTCGLDYTLSNAWGDAPSQNHSVALNVTRANGDNGSVKGGINYSNDIINKVWSIGPELALEWTKNRPRVRGMDPLDREIFTLGLDNEINNYSADVGGGSGRGFTKTGQTVTTTSGQSTLYITQYYPNFSLDLPLFRHSATLNLSGGHYFYSSDPAVVAGLIAQRFSSGNGVLKVNNLVGTLYNDAWKVGLDLKLFWGLGLSGSYGRQHLVSPDTWADSSEASLSRVFFDTVKLEAGATQSNVPGAVLTDVTAALTLFF